MKFKIFLYILLIGFLAYAFFIPVESGFTDASLIPEVEEIEEESEANTEGSEDVSSETAEQESSVVEEPESEIDLEMLSEKERLLYDLSMTHENPNGILLTRDQIQTLNDATIENCDSVINIMDLPTSMPTETVLGYIQKTEYPVLPKYDNGTAIAPEELDTIVQNMNADGEVPPMTLGIITTRTDLRALPTDKAFCTSADDLYYDQIQVSALYCSMPVWILHNSTDGEWLYVQTYYSRGWVHADTVAVAPSEDVWKSYAEPENRVVITDSQLTLNGTLVDMGCVFTCLEDTGTSFTILLPVRAEDGTLTAKEATVSYESAHNGYLDYTWTNFYTQMFKYEGVDYGWGGADGGVDESSLPGYVMRSFGILLPHDLQAQDENFGSALPLTDMTAQEKPTALDALQLPALLYKGDKVTVYLGCFDGMYYEMYAPKATENVLYGEITEWDRLNSAVVIN